MFPPEIINYIFLYCQGSTNQIMKTHIKRAKSFDTGVIGLNRLKNDYGFKVFNYYHFKKAITCQCVTCGIVLWPCEYKKKLLRDHKRMCSRRCLNVYDTVFHNGY